MQHLRGVAPQMDVYRRPPLPAVIRPILPGLWSPSRSFDPHAGIAAFVWADAFHTLCEWHPDGPGLRSLPSPSRRSLGVDIAPFRSCILVAHGPAFRLGKRSAAMVPGVSSRTERLSTLLATAKLQVRTVSPQPVYCGRDDAEAIAGRFPAVDDQVLGRRHISVPVLGSREDPPESTLAGDSARLPSAGCPVVMASLHLSHRLGYFLWKTGVERSDLIPLELAFDPAFHRYRPWLATLADDALPESVRSGSSCRVLSFRWASCPTVPSPCACPSGFPPGRLAAKGSRPTSLGFLTFKDQPEGSTFGQSPVIQIGRAHV